MRNFASEIRSGDLGSTAESQRGRGFRPAGEFDEDRTAERVLLARVPSAVSRRLRVVGQVLSSRSATRSRGGRARCAARQWKARSKRGRHRRSPAADREPGLYGCGSSRRRSIRASRPRPVETTVLLETRPLATASSAIADRRRRNLPERGLVRGRTGQHDGDVDYPRPTVEHRSRRRHSRW